MTKNEYQKCQMAAILYRNLQAYCKKLEARVAELEGQLAEQNQEDSQVIIMVNLNRQRAAE